MLQKSNYKHSLKALSVYFLLSYAFLYFAYKYFAPDIACVDFFNYYPLYKDFDVQSVGSPFNTRLLNPLFVFVFNKLGIYYNTYTSFQNPDINQSVFFNALLVSYLAVVFTALVIYLTCYNYFKNKLFSFFVGLFYLMGGGTLVFCINPATDAFSVLLLALIFKSYTEKSKWIYLLLLLAVFQREYIFMVISLIAIIDFWFDRKNLKNYLSVVLAAVICFGIYMILRSTILYTPAHPEQLEYSQYISRLLFPKINFSEYIRQGLFTQNILFTYLFVIMYKLAKKQTVVKKNISIIGMLILQINFICLIALLGNNIGRIFYMTTPIILYYLAIEVYPIYSKYQFNQGNTSLASKNES
jgi:hypothetical protein